MLNYPKRSVIMSIIFFLSAVGVTIFILKVPLKIGEYSGFEIKIISPTAEGLGIGSPVLMSGVQIGKVKKIELSEDGKRAIITVAIKAKTKIAKDSKVEFRMKGILGDRIVVFIQGEKLDEPLKNGDIVFVGEEKTEISQITGNIETVAKELTETLRSIKHLSENMNKLVDNINGVVSDIREKKIEEDIKMASYNLSVAINEASKTIREIGELVEKIRGTVGKIEPSIHEFSQDLTEISKNLKRASDDIKEMVEIARKNGIIHLVAGKDSKKIERIINNLDGLSTKISDITEKAENITSTEIKIGGRLESGLQEEKPVFSQQISTRIKRKDTFFEIGLVSPPREDKISFNALVGINSRYFELSAGFTRSKPSLLTEIKPTRFFFIRGEGIGFFSPNIRAFLGGRYKLFGIYAGVENILKQKRFFLLGVEFRD